MKRTIKIFFKDGTDITFEIEDIWLPDISNDIKDAMDRNFAYVLRSRGKNNQDRTLVLPTKNIKYIDILDNNKTEEHENDWNIWRFKKCS